jgi:lipopolysaccharide/colanic/teichoic acid biosynthesis glycosyltransferase
VVDGRPILFRQRRAGQGGRLFTILKFRTMTSAAERGSAGDEARITRLGAFLRATSLDELPELLNVLKGDMSLVGPRPLLPEYLDRYTAEQARRHEVKPGVTGLAQVNGRNEVDWGRRLALDVWYVDHRSLLLDLRILLRTFGVVFSRRGINAAGHATMPEFQGALSAAAPAEE